MGRFHDAVNEQIANEFAASQQYIAIAVWYDAESLPHLAAHFYRQAVEERNHAMMLVQFLLDADYPVAIPPVGQPQTEFKDATEPVALALEQERRVTAQITTLLGLAREEGDFSGEEAMHWFLKEQREEVSTTGDLLKLVQRALESNILLAEDSLARTQVGDAGVDPSSPPAAGGAL
jgi:bacterioferritin B